MRARPDPKPKPKIVSHDTRRALYAAYLAGVTPQTLAKTYGLDEALVHVLLRRQACKRTFVRLPSETRREIAMAYASGVKRSALETRYGVRRDAPSKYARNAGLARTERKVET